MPAKVGINAPKIDHEQRYYVKQRRNLHEIIKGSSWTLDSFMREIGLVVAEICERSGSEQHSDVSIRRHEHSHTAAVSANIAHMGGTSSRTSTDAKSRPVTDTIKATPLAIIAPTARYSRLLGGPSGV